MSEREKEQEGVEGGEGGRVEARSDPTDQPSTSQSSVLRRTSEIAAVTLARCGYSRARGDDDDGDGDESTSSSSSSYGRQCGPSRRGTRGRGEPRRVRANLRCNGSLPVHASSPLFRVPSWSDEVRIRGAERDSANDGPEEREG